MPEGGQPARGAGDASGRQQASMMTRRLRAPGPLARRSSLLFLSFFLCSFLLVPLIFSFFIVSSPFLPSFFLSFTHFFSLRSFFLEKPRLLTAIFGCFSNSPANRDTLPAAFSGTAARNQPRPRPPRARRTRPRRRAPGTAARGAAQCCPRRPQAPAWRARRRRRWPANALRSHGQPRALSGRTGAGNSDQRQTNKPGCCRVHSACGRAQSGTAGAPEGRSARGPRPAA